MKRKNEWLVPLTGVLFVVIAIVAFALGGEPPEAKEGGRKIIEHYVDNKDSIQLSSVLVGLAAVVFVFFFGYLRKVLHAAEGPDGMLSAIALVGAAIVAVGIAFDATISFALAEAADDITAPAAQAVETIWDNDWIPLVVGAILILLSTGISVIKHGALPKWLGWVAIALAVVGLTPIGFVSFLGLAVWILIVSVLLALRARRESGPPQTPAPPPGAAPTV